MKPAYTQALAWPRSRALDFVELTKPRIAVMVLFTVAAGALLAGRGPVDVATVLHALVGVGLTAAAASVLNQLLERHSDALMRRTENRPLPAGRLQPGEVLVFGTVLAILGLGYLAATMKHPLAVLVTAFTLVSYVFVYTPLKRHTTLNTLVGAVPGALPPVIGWTAMTGSFDREAFALFLILFLWQVPHFLAIAWLYREDYGRAGLQMLPVIDGEGAMTARQMVAYCLALVPASLLPTLFQQAGWLYATSALVLGIGFTRATLSFWRERSRSSARQVLHASLVYLPALLLLMLIDHWI